MARIMIAATGSGCGKTTVTCAVLQALKDRGCDLAALKCGPDYIDPMFHRAVIGTAAGNLDSFFMPADFLRSRLAEQEARRELCVLEGAMGYYDGIGSSTEGSAWQMACLTATPVVLVLSCRGMGCHSIAAVLRGFLAQENHQIAGVIFNQLSAGLYEDVCAAMASLPVRPLGYLPRQEAFRLESRHLGLVTAQEVQALQEKMARLARQAEQSLDLDGLLELAATARPLERRAFVVEPVAEQPVTIGVARDSAFCFLYEENLQLLRQLGAELAFFSPLADGHLPEDCCGLYLCGGYPELYGAQLAANKTLLAEIKAAIDGGMPVIAECGGFLYLHRTLEDETGKRWPLVGALPGKAWPTGKLQRFGYVTLEAQGENLSGQSGLAIRGHEFHYWESDCCGHGFVARKAGRSRSWLCVNSSESFYAGFPHLYFYSNPDFARGFIRKAVAYGRLNGIAAADQTH